jgi:hypothetical protein
MSRRAIFVAVNIKSKALGDIADNRAPNLSFPPAMWQQNQPFSAARRATDKFVSDNKSLLYDSRGPLLQNVLDQYLVYL